MTHKCLYCYQLLPPTTQDFHPACSKKMFGQATAPELPYTEKDMEALAVQVIQSHITVTGVQPKLSLHLSPADGRNAPKRFTIVDLWSSYILKPPSSYYLQLPEVEDLTMHLAAIAGIKTVPHTLTRLQSGNLAYLTKRIDRVKKQKWHMEDMCQLTEQLTEDKYHGSYEQVAKPIQKYSLHPGLDTVDFYELVLFSFLTGNANMHLKNFSLLHHPGYGPALSPAYDLVATALLNPANEEETALTLNGKKRRIRKSDFVAAFNAAKMDIKQQENLFKRMNSAKIKWLPFIDRSFVSSHYKEQFKTLIEERFARLTA